MSEEKIKKLRLELKSFRGAVEDGYQKILVEGELLPTIDQDKLDSIFSPIEDLMADILFAIQVIKK